MINNYNKNHSSSNSWFLFLTKGFIEEKAVCILLETFVWAKVRIDHFEVFGAISVRCIVAYGCFRSFPVVWALFMFVIISGYFRIFLCLVMAGILLLGSFQRFSLPGMVTNRNPLSWVYEGQLSSDQCVRNHLETFKIRSGFLTYSPIQSKMTNPNSGS